MVVEVTSSNPDHHRVAKRHCYARAALPPHLLIDRDTSAVTLLSDPTADDYTAHTTVPFGKPLPLPPPSPPTWTPANSSDRGVRPRPRLPWPPWPTTSTRSPPLTSPSGAST
ncbi:Uma2 family endonuclease [Streptomyces rhizoryzae]|uniref:Uma2 family endonuclease n=1 Tax=Streptomyces rhizoryzae TaxID=2932493 RepID=UPI0035586BF0